MSDSIRERLQAQAAATNDPDLERLLRDAYERLYWFESSGGVAVHTRVHELTQQKADADTTLQRLRELNEAFKQRAENMRNNMPLCTSQVGDQAYAMATATLIAYERFTDELESILTGGKGEQP